MKKRDEIEDHESCFNKARDDERLFVLLARDAAAPVAVRAWVAERLRLGKNSADDDQIREAIECAQLMEAERAEMTASRKQQHMNWTVAVPSFAVTLLSTPEFPVVRRDLTWGEIVGLLSDPRRTPCTVSSCERGLCEHKRGGCWSPAVFANGAWRRGAIESTSLLVFDVDRSTDDQVDEIRAQISSLRYLIHSTHSDRPDDRAVRIVVALSRPVAPEEWSVFWRAAQQFLAPSADPAAADPARAYFLPSRPSDAGYFVQVNEGAALDVDFVRAFVTPRAEHPTAGGEVSP